MDTLDIPQSRSTPLGDVVGDKLRDVVDGEVFIRWGGIYVVSTAMARFLPEDEVRCLRFIQRKEFELVMDDLGRRLDDPKKTTVGLHPEILSAISSIWVLAKKTCSSCTRPDCSHRDEPVNRGR